LIVALGSARRAIVLSWFAPAHAQDFALAEGPPTGPAAAHVRIILIDGLGQADADATPSLQRMCEKGRGLTVDVGFPTVSLPVQHVLWTGLTQQQSGVVFSNRRLSPPPAFAMPARVDSIAVAESHGEIVRSFGFGQVHAPPDSEQDEAWAAEGFATAAELALRGDQRLAFVHILRVDEAGHAHGRDSSEYRAAATSAGALVEAWLPDTVPAGDVWLVLADHGHHDAGGHGGAAPSIRRVRVCVRTGPPLSVPETPAVPLIDVAATIAAWLQTPLPVLADGDSLYQVQPDPVPGGTLPRPMPAAAMLALCVWIAGLWFGHRRGHGRWARPWWALVAYGGVLLLHGLPTLSQGLVFPAYGAATLLAAAPGGILAAVSARIAYARHPSIPAIASALLCAPLALWVAVLLASGTLAAPWTHVAGPAVMPYLSAHASVLASILQVGVLGVAVGIAAAHRALLRR
ncbi:MAG: hypothetical protein AAF721_35260, partial [Myxococcota bacterium]